MAIKIRTETLLQHARKLDDVREKINLELSHVFEKIKKYLGLKIRTVKFGRSNIRNINVKQYLFKRESFPSFEFRGKKYECTLTPPHTPSYPPLKT